METIEKIRAKRKTVRSASTKFVNKVKSFLETFDSQNETHQEQLSEYLLNLDAKQIELQTLNKEIEDLLSDKELLEAEIEGSLEYEENINEVRYKIKSKINKIHLSQTVVNSKGANESTRKPLERTFEVVNLILGSRFPPFQTINIEALVTSEISGAEIYSDFTPKLLRNLIPAGCQMADTFQNGPIKILLGANFLVNTMTGEPIKINKNLFLLPTIFGRTLIGQLPYSQKGGNAAVFHMSCEAVESDLERIWGMESFLLGDELTRGYVAENILSDFGKEVKKKNERYEVPLQWKTNGIKGNLSSNFDVAEKRFICLEKRFNRDELLFERYNSVMKEQLKQGIIEKCAKNCFAGYVMPHREVFREISSSTKTRVVYDASSKQGNNLSLNECLISGENLNPILINVVLKFREHKSGFCGDIARAFLQIQVAEIDRNYLCFLYYDNCDRTQPVTMYHFNRHCFGVTCSPFSLSLVLAATIKTHINDYKIKYPEAYEMLNESLYVDDLFFGSSTVQEAFKLSSEAVLILKEASMNMRKFDTNSEELKNLWRSSNSLIEINENSDSYLKVLGLVWNNSDDTLGLDLKSLLSNLNNKECE
ncbi:integrase catalytic domain-containing protein [Trichonephila clavipes]|nr:integrase catalytic domain-containing protein [Trichonephila clavipes]